MLIDRFTKFSLSILVFSLCLNALNPWLSTNLANADTEDNNKKQMKIIAQGIKRIADVFEKQEQRALREEHRNTIRYEEQRTLRRYEQQRTQREDRLKQRN